MIDKETGAILLSLGSLCVSPTLARGTFLANAVSDKCRVLVRNEPYCSFAMPSALFDGQRIEWSLWFTGQELSRVSISVANDEFDSSWANWSEEKELARKKQHDSLLKSVFGSDMVNYEFPWGEAVSIYDGKGGASSIIVVYSRAAT
jgi:hypothetical protein